MKIISYSLFKTPGKNSFYHFLPSLLRAHFGIFKDYKLVIYHDDTIYDEFYGGVLLNLSKRGLIELRRFQSEKLCLGMLQRCKAIWDFPEAEAIFFRDMDSCPINKELHLSELFIRSDKFVHGINDEVSHTIPLMGGMWGCKPKCLIQQFNTFEIFIQEAKSTGLDFSQHGTDQKFLTTKVYPKIQNQLLIHRNVEFENALDKEFINYIGSCGYRTNRVIQHFNVETNENIEILKSLESWTRSSCVYNASDKSSASLNRDRVILSCTDNLDYAFYLPFVCLAWQKYMNYCPIVFIVGKLDAWLVDEKLKHILEHTRMTGAEIYFLSNTSEFQDSTIAQMSRLYACMLKNYTDSTYMLTSDVDMMPLCLDFFHKQDFSKQLHLYYANAYSHEKYPICYVGATRGLWNQIVNPPKDTIEDSIVTELLQGLGSSEDTWKCWIFDEEFLGRKIKSSSVYPEGAHFIDRHGCPPGDRIDRCCWKFDGSLKGKSDSHLLRPSHRGPNWILTRELLQVFFTEQDFIWVENYAKQLLE